MKDAHLALLGIAKSEYTQLIPSAKSGKFGQNSTFSEVFSDDACEEELVVSFSLKAGSYQLGVDFSLGYCKENEGYLPYVQATIAQVSAQIPVVDTSVEAFFADLAVGAAKGDHGIDHETRGAVFASRRTSGIAYTGNPERLLEKVDRLKPLAEKVILEALDWMRETEEDSARMESYV
jgi:hypothetical protein